VLQKCRADDLSRDPRVFRSLGDDFGPQLNLHLLVYRFFAWVVTFLFVVTYEEPTLHRTFGASESFPFPSSPFSIPMAELRAQQSPWKEAPCC
jgi:hypothetical protein